MKPGQKKSHRTGNPEVDELFVKADRTNEKIQEMLNELLESTFTSSPQELRAKQKAIKGVESQWKQEMNSAFKALSLARKAASTKWGVRPNDRYIVKGDIRGRISSHREIDDAIKAAKRDRERCKHLGGGAYSDVLVYQIGLNGELHAVDEHAYEKHKQ